MLGVVLPNKIAICDYGGEATDRRPFVGGIEEGDIDVGVGGEVVRFSAMGVGVEEEVYAAVFLFAVSMLITG